MNELASTRANPLVDPALHVWGWEIPVYLFVGGLVAGMMILNGLFLREGRLRSRRSVCRLFPWLSLGLLSLGMLALWLDLEHKAAFWRLYTTFQIGSPMSWGAWILLAVYPALLAAGLLAAADGPPGDLFPRARRWGEALRARAGAVAAANLTLGGLLGIYTGVLLSALGPSRPLWNSALLGPLFLLSGLSAAAALGHWLAREPEEREGLARADSGLLGAEAALLALFLIGLASAGRAGAAAAALVLGGPYTALFWVVVVGAGIAIPLPLQILATAGRIRPTAVAPLLVLAGGLGLRVLLVAAGQASAASPF